MAWLNGKPKESISNSPKFFSRVVSRHKKEPKMSQILSQKLKEDFYLTLYFNISKGFKNAGLKRAYLDFNRTLKIKDGNQLNRNLQQQKTQSYLKSELKRIIVLKVNSQAEFDHEHKILCNNLISEWNELTIGQAQKWINMTLKYWLLFGEERIENIEKNAEYFHIPIDSYVQKGMFSEKNPNAWSNILDYDTYFSYQLKHRNKNTGNPPILDELDFFNNYKK